MTQNIQQTQNSSSSSKQQQQQQQQVRQPRVDCEFSAPVVQLELVDDTIDDDGSSHAEEDEKSIIGSQTASSGLGRGPLVGARLTGVALVVSCRGSESSECGALLALATAAGLRVSDRVQRVGGRYATLLEAKPHIVEHMDQSGEADKATSMRYDGLHSSHSLHLARLEYEAPPPASMPVPMAQRHQTSRCTRRRRNDATSATADTGPGRSSSRKAESVTTVSNRPPVRVRIAFETPIEVGWNPDTFVALRSFLSRRSRVDVAGATSSAAAPMDRQAPGPPPTFSWSIKCRVFSSTDGTTCLYAIAL